MPCANGNGNGDDLDLDHEDSLLGLVMDHSTKSSMVSLDPLDRLNVLQRVNADLNRKCMEAEQTLQHKLLELELELEELQSQLEEVRSELVHMKREEKELRSKDVCFFFLLFFWRRWWLMGLIFAALKHNTD